MPRSDRLSRLLRMILVIQRRPGLTAEELARACGVGPRQCFRDLQVLGYAGIPIYNDNGYRFMDRFSLQNISFSLDEALSLLYGLKLMERQKDFFPTARVKERLLFLLPKGLRDEIEDLDPRVDVAENPAADYAGKAVLFRALNEAILRNAQVEMEYYSFSRDETTKRIVDPYHLVFKDGFWYLAAYCHTRGEVRLFRVDRVRRFHLLDERFVPPVDFRLDSYLGAAWSMDRGEEFTFQVRFTGDSARFVRETHFHPSQAVVPACGLERRDLESANPTARRPDPSPGREEAVIFTATAGGLRSVARWVLGFGAEAEVLAPAELREMVAGELRRGAERYG